ncbi:MAG TPA: response regulator [Pyrinomonadaceae bacterium]|nr:response regulator [Pyrinomonadaceae bacterium]
MALFSFKGNQALLAGRKILLADDSITIQKVVELSFADEGAEVVCVSNGREAIERLENFHPDIVLADVFMPQVSGYELCEYIKQNAELKHIPVMLLVGSFEPFNESEARRVGADDTLTKPFQSIRRLLEKVGLLAEGATPEEMIQTAEYPKVDQPEPQKLSDTEIELTTADTRQLRPAVPRIAPDSAAPLPDSAISSTTDDAKMEPKVMDVAPQQQRATANEELLDLGDLHQPVSVSTEEFVLDIDLDAAPETPSTERYPAYVGRPDLRTTVRDLRTVNFPHREATATVEPPAQSPVAEASDWSTDRFAQTENFSREFVEPAIQPASPESVVSEDAQPTLPSGMITLDQISPEVIDAIARRAVEQLSEKAVQEIAWEVVPQLAELLIKRQLEEKSS